MKETTCLDRALDAQGTAFTTERPNCHAMTTKGIQWYDLILIDHLLLMVLFIVLKADKSNLQYPLSYMIASENRTKNE